MSGLERSASYSAVSMTFKNGHGVKCKTSTGVERNIGWIPPGQNSVQLGDNISWVEVYASGQVGVTAANYRNYFGANGLVLAAPGAQVTAINSAKAWVNFDGGGTLTKLDGFHVDSVTDEGVGLYGVNITAGAVASAVYGVLLGAESYVLQVRAGKTAIYLPVETQNGGTYFDVNDIGVAIMASA